MTPQQLEYFQQKLVSLKERIVGDISHLEESALGNSQREATGDLSGYSLHMADQGTDNYDREFTFDLVSNERNLLKEIDAALERIDNGTYGVCEVSGEEISVSRLEAIPYTRISIKVAQEQERRRRR
ncbi:TraR/DksA C4-type zinc finger protein [bacterium]|nr:TraR/DksA C4-type zinc finger protein [bacterium]MCP5462403.1 TraR/DksA C4-type zinc finger protein [bacterium]